jgi:predicted DCC family thiol-disulfide oxidoreductase YuxK
MPFFIESTYSFPAFTVKRIIKIRKIPNGTFKFASLQSAAGQKLLKSFGVKNELNSFVLIEDKNIYFKSSAALQVCKNLTGAWKLLFIFKIIPPFIRDSLYDIVANNRYKWFGKEEFCMLPTPETKKRFLD